MKQKYQVYQGIENKRKVFVAVSAEIDPDEAIRIANDKFRLNKLCLNIEPGYTLGKYLFFGYPAGEHKNGKPIWVVTKKVG